MPVRKVGARWLVDIRHQGERYRVRSPGTTKGDAQSHETHLRRQLAEHGRLEHLSAPSAESAIPTFSAFAERWMQVFPHAERNRASEIANKSSILRVHLLPAFGAFQLDAIGGAEIAKFKAACTARGLTAKTLNNLLSVLRCILDSAEEWEVVEKMPRIRFAQTERPDFRFLTETEAKKLVDATNDPLWRAAILLGWHAGLRWGEIAGLTWDDVFLDRRQLKIRQAWSRTKLERPKNGRIRFLPLTRILASALTSLPRQGEYVLMLRARPLVQKTALLHLAALGTKAGIKPHGWHVLRHTFASHLVQRGVPLPVVKELLGHSSIKMTEMYAHLQPSGIAEDATLHGRAAVELLEHAGAIVGHSVGTPLDVLDRAAVPAAPAYIKTPLDRATFPWSG